MAASWHSSTTGRELRRSRHRSRPRSCPKPPNRCRCAQSRRQVGADALWAQGITGAGVNVAVIDTGVAPVAGLDGAVVAAVDVSVEYDDPARRHVDGNGHGTHLAGIIAGRDASTGFTGIAPGAGIVSVKVAGRDGAVTPESVITGIDWVVAHADQLDIRVINLALDTNDASHYRTSALAAAVERAWAAGIVVVTAAGNDGQSSAGLSLPASDPFVIAVAGLEAGHGGLAAPEWASIGDGVRDPDLAAPGAHIMSLRAPGSVADVDHPEGYVNEQLFKGTGSSQSAAVVAGLAALMLEVRPELSPDEVKAALVASSVPVAGGASVVGAGAVRVDRARGADVDGAAQTWAPAAPASEVSGVAGAMTLANPAGSSWTGSSWTGSSWTGSSWTGSSWTGSSWTGSSWTGSSWTGSSWTGSSWTGSSWTGSSWTGSSWTGSSWTGSSWTGSSWTGSSWTGSSWTGSSWTGSSWTGSSWT